MRCRHTVPDWHRFVSPGDALIAIAAACRLLVREGEAAKDPRAIACSYWGHQEDCPMYEGPRTRPAPVAVGAESPSADVPVAAGSAWPVRAPGDRDPFGALLGGLAIASILLLASAAGLALAWPGGLWRVRGLLMVAAALSILTHGLSLLKAWAAR
ncbi:MAG TPA: hypothetical protein VMG58_08605 [Candidatus Sulfotelmatobacter sp.]|nr:hypothetical protein [Candidatus Sulfotelmatobacter sp.]